MNKNMLLSVVLLMSTCCIIQAMEIEIEGAAIEKKQVSGNFALQLRDVLMEFSLRGEEEKDEQLKEKVFALISEIKEHGEDINIEYDGSTLLHAASLAPCEIINALLDAGVDPNIPDKEGKILSKGQVLLHSIHRLEVGELLIAKKADPTIRDEEGNTSLHLNNKPELVQKLKKAGADLNAQNKDGNTSLHIWTERSCESMVKALTIAGANPNIQNRYGDTPLHIAANSDYSFSEMIITMLLSARTNVCILNEDGETALDIHLRKIFGRGEKRIKRKRILRPKMINSMQQATKK